jgi:hypothetical protein
MKNDKTTKQSENKTTPIIASKWWIGSLSVLIVAIFIQTLASFFPAIIETYYSRKVYPYIGKTLGFFNKITWFSIAEFLFIVVILSIIIYFTYNIKKIYQKTLTKKEFLLKTLWRSFTSTSIAFLAFLLLWGLNYQKQSLAENLNLAPIPQTQDSEKELIEVCKEFIKKTNQSYREANEPTFYLTANKPNYIPNVSQHSILPMDWATLNKLVEESFQKEILLKNLCSGSYAPAKAVYFSSSMSYLGISGIFIPLTGEPNVNVAQTPVAIPFTLAHEKAHQRGFALEDEANFLAFLVCANSENAYLRYSGYLMATTYLLNNLAAVAPQEYSEIRQTLNTGAKNDLKAMYNFWKQYEGKLSEASEKVNNSYLKANRVRSGIRNYNQVVDLIVRYYFTYLYRNNTDRQNFSFSNKS